MNGGKTLLIGTRLGGARPYIARPFLLEGRELEMTAGDLLVAPEGVPHGVHNTGSERLLVLAVLAPGPR